ncbi:MAG: C69 family dipeptidase [Bacteroidales bacterium]|nr:C69 family dipeptidase [Bacteroidales bacterium]
MIKRYSFLMVMVLLGSMMSNAVACTNFLFSRGSTRDGSTMITYAADSHTRYGQLRYHPATDHRKGEMLRIYDYGSLRYLLSIPQPSHTYNVVGFINEHQLAIGETTFGGRAELSKGNAEGIDYGNLIYVALQRARNCREAIVVMHELVSTYGYCSSGESFSLCDPNEVWIMEIISKGNEKGAVWVARKVPEGYVCGHANQARITTFPQERITQRGEVAISSRKLKSIGLADISCVYSDDVVSFARRRGWYSGSDSDFSFADTYCPVDFGGARFCDARVYAMFRRVAQGMERYEAYAMGNISAERPPLWIKPDHLIDVHEVMELMRDHFEGTPMDMRHDAGAGPYHCPYRQRPMTWEYEGHTYIHERATSTQQTGFSFVAQCRRWMPAKAGGILWLGVDDTYSTVYCPMYCGLTQVPECFREGNGSMTQYSTTSAFWLFNRVANFAYGQYDRMIGDIRAEQRALEESFISTVLQHDEQLLSLSDSPRLETQLNLLSNRAADRMMKAWTQLSNDLLVRYHE